MLFNCQGNGQILGAHNPDNESKLELRSPSESQRFQSHLQLQLNQISHPVQEQPHNNISKFQNVFTERDFDFVSNEPLQISKQNNTKVIEIGSYCSYTSLLT